MEGTRIKICGLMRPEDIEAVNAVCPAYAGFILAEGRRRTVTPERMRELADGLLPQIMRTAVFVDQDPAWITHLAQTGLMDVIQLHGHESDDEIRMLRGESGLPVIKAFRIGTADDIRRAQESAADLVLFDHGAGGTGEAFDWALTAAGGRAFILAGGLDPDNVREAVGRTHPFAVDVSSGVETDGRKDPEKIRQFARAVRGEGQ